jgi:AAA15 family ATPase/GTPase
LKEGDFMAQHFTEIGIETYRAIKDFYMKDIGDVNILVGDNNSGKTSVLEQQQR